MICTLKVLGCSGGIAKDLRTTSFLLNENILIDAGTGVGDLTLDQLRKIDYLFLTHSHLDHVCSLPFLLDAVGVKRHKPLRVFGIRQTIEALQTHIFNNVIWPDFTKIPSPEHPCITTEIIQINQTIKLGEVEITALPVSHSIPANAYWIDSSKGALVFSGDTGPSPEFWDAISRKNNEQRTQVTTNQNDSYLKHLIIEASFTNAEYALAKLSGHYHPEQLAQDLRKLVFNPQIWISHLKPDEGATIMQEIKHALTGSKTAQSLQHHQTLSF